MIAGVDKKAGALFSGLQSAFLPGAFQGSDYRGSHGRYPPAFLFGQVDGLCGFRADEKRFFQHPVVGDFSSHR